MKNPFSLAALAAALLFGAVQAQGQSVIYNFSDGLPDGWASGGFGNSPAAPVANFGGQNYIFGALGGFQVLNVSSGSGSDLFNAMQAAAANPAGYNISYDWRVDTSAFGGNPRTFLQLGTFVNTGSGYYAQNYGASQVQLDGTQMASGQVFSGHVSINMAAAGFNMPADTFYRLGFVVNGDSGATGGAYFTDISITPVPEPSTLSLFGVVATAFWLVRRRHLARRRAVLS